MAGAFCQRGANLRGHFEDARMPGKVWRDDTLSSELGAFASDRHHVVDEWKPASTSETLTESSKCLKEIPRFSPSGSRKLAPLSRGALSVDVSASREAALVGNIWRCNELLRLLKRLRMEVRK